MSVAALVPPNASRRVPRGDRHAGTRRSEGSTTDGSTTEVPVQLARADSDGSVPALARLPSPDRIELRCSRIALALLVPEGGRFLTPQTLPRLRARVYVPQRRCSEPVLVGCALSEVVVSGSGEFILRGSTTDVSPEDRVSLAQFCAR